MSEAVDEARLETTGVESEAVDEALEPIGHVLMLDYDDALPETVLEDARAIDGPAVVVASSVGSYHVYGLALRSLEEAIEEAQSTEASSEYLEEMDRRGMFTLRTGPKEADGEIETPAPVPIRVTMTLEHPTDVSRPHTAQLRSMAERAGIDDVARRLAAIETGAVPGLEPVGEQLPRTRYETRGGDC